MTVATDAPKLIGTTRWNPRGESMLTVLEKVGLYNHLTPRELATMVGAHGPLTFTAVERSNPGDPAVVRLDELRALAGWPRDALNASFPAFYRPPGSDLSVPDTVFFDFHPVVRICRICAPSGLHLLLHQSRTFARCPIHGELLTINCPVCRTQLGRYAYPPDPQHSIRCNHCGWRALSNQGDFNEELQEERVRLIDDFAGWMSEIERAATGAHERVRLLDPPRRFADIARLDALIPGPRWLARSLEATTCVQTVHRTLGFRNADIDPALSPAVSGAVDVRGVCHSKAADRWNRRVDDAAIDRVAALHRGLPRIYNPQDRYAGVRLASFGYNIFLSEFSSVAALGFRWWEDCLGATVPARGERQAFRMAARGTQPARIWSAWLDGPGRLFTTQYTSTRQGIRINRQGVVIGKHWMDHFLETLFLAFVGRASIVPDRPIQPDELLDEAYDLGATAVTAMVREGATVSLVMTRVLAPEADFRQLFKSGYTGCELDLARTARTGNPVHDLIGLSLERRERSNALLELAACDRVKRLPGEHVSEEPAWKRHGKPQALIEAEAEIASFDPPSATPVRILVESDINTEEEINVALAPLMKDPRVTLTSHDQVSWTVAFSGRRWRLWPTGRRRWIELDNMDAPKGVHHFGTPDVFYRKCIMGLRSLPRNTAKVWEGYERRLLIQLIAREVPVASIASDLGRSPRGVVQKAGSLQGINLEKVLNLPDMEELSIKQLIAKEKTL